MLTLTSKYSGAVKMSTVSPDTSLRGGTLHWESNNMGLSVSINELSEKLSTSLTCPKAWPGGTNLFCWGTCGPTFSLSEKTLESPTLLVMEVELNVELELEGFLGSPAFSSQKMVKSVLND